MITEPYIDKVVADSAAFLRNVPLHQMAHEVLTVPDVVAEIRDKATRERLQVLPYDLKLREPSDECVRLISDFARETGDFRFLSLTDVRVLALTLQVTRETVGAAHLRLRPPADARPQLHHYHPRQGGGRGDDGGGGDSGAADPADEWRDAGGGGAADQDAAENADDPPSEEMFDAKETPDDDTGDEASDGVDEANGDDGDDSDGDDGGWITPGNIQAAKSTLSAQAGETEEPVKVACMTTDFTMQNVLKKMNLEMVSVEGRRISQARRFILRCFGCMQTTPRMDKTFCPWCGNKTLKRVAVTLRPDGTQQIHISTRKEISKRGTKFSLPLPRGGKYSVSPILCEDQPVPQRRATARSQAQNAILSEDFVAGGSPFSLNDVNSRAAQLGRNARLRHVPNWERRNPNARAPPTGNKKKRRK
ncbi:RNA-binding protein NOB1-like [Pollicipes pollicipes]|uniref:RNA-binding protein NOB1-like n=1 Tax=Pollicipes pollicipes TaxID=41117 RepID=UPI001884EA3B|nr:RNA-binding protein NOB1-like [Pollicipes pollicipes]